MTPAEADYLLDEWARWQRADPLTMGWPDATPFGRQIKPDPAPSRIPIDDDRALRTDRVLAKMPARIRFIAKMHYLDLAPIDQKARRLRLGRKAYLAKIEGIKRVVAARLDETRKQA